MEAYFDNSATTKALDSVRDIMVKTLTGVIFESLCQAYKRVWKQKTTSVRLQPILQRP